MKTPSTLSKIIVCLFIAFYANIYYSYSQNHQWSYDCGRSSGQPSITTDSQGNVYLLAYTDTTLVSPVNIGNFTLTHSADILKFDNQGNVLWAKNFPPTQFGREGNGGKLIAAATSPSTQQTSIYVAGAVHPYITQSYAAYVKYDENANFQWQNAATGSTTTSSGKAIAVDSDGSIYMTGYFNGTNITFGSIVVPHSNSQGYEYFIVKYDSSGNVQWAVNPGLQRGWLLYAGIGIDSHNSVYVLLDAQDGSVIFGNDTMTNINASASNSFLLKFDSNGNKIWGRSVGGNGKAIGRDLGIDGSDNIIVAGDYEAPINIPALNSEGNMVIKYDINGNLLWANGSVCSYQITNATSVDLYGNTYLCGAFTAAHIYFDSLTLENYDTISGVNDAYYAKFDNNGNFLHADAFGRASGWGMDINCMTSDLFGNTFMAGYYTSPYIVLGNDTLSDSSTERKLFITKISAHPNSIGNISESNSLLLFPNPVNDILNISANDLNGNIIILIYDVYGKLVFENRRDVFSNSTINISMKSFASGIYFIDVINEERRYVYKIIKS